MLGEASGQVLVEHSIGLFGDGWVDSVRSSSGAGVDRRDGTLNRIREQESKAVLDVEKSSGNSQRTLSKRVTIDEDRPGSWRSNVMSRKCTGGRTRLVR